MYLSSISVDANGIYADFSSSTSRWVAWKRVLCRFYPHYLLLEKPEITCTQTVLANISSKLCHRTIVISSKMMSVARTFRSDPGRFRGVRHDGQGSRPGAIISDRTGPGAGSAMTARQQASGGDWKLRLRICGTRSAPDTRFPRTLDIHFLGTVPAWPTNSSSPTFFRDLGCAKDIWNPKGLTKKRERRNRDESKRKRLREDRGRADADGVKETYCYHSCR